MSNPGKWVVGTIIAVALAAAATAWWYTYWQGQRVLTLWGAETARRIRLAPNCELWVIAPVASSDAGASMDADERGRSDATNEVELRIGKRRWRVQQSVSIDQAPGFVHARQSLIDDHSFRWDGIPLPLEVAQWQYALRFRDSTGESLLVFDFERQLVMSVEGAQVASIAPIASALQRYFDQSLERPGTAREREIPGREGESSAAPGPHQ
jgi:hypothetical protein